MKLIYIAGKFTGSDLPAINVNIAQAEWHANELNKTCRGRALAVCPHSLGRVMVGTMTPEFWYEATLALLERCDAILLIPGWEDSSGSVREAQRAKELGLPVFKGLADVLEWAVPLPAKPQPELGTVLSSELETMLTALMGPDGPYRVEDVGKEWRWTRTRTTGAFHLTVGRIDPVITTPDEALQAINARLAELTPKGCRLGLTVSGCTYWLRAAVNGGTYGRLYWINSDLGARVTEVLKWIAEQPKATQ